MAKHAGKPHEPSASRRRTTKQQAAAKREAFQTPAADDAPRSDRLAWILLALTLTGVAILRYRLWSFPLERDEGEYAYGGQLLLQGVAPYDLFYTLKLPGTHAMYALIMAVFGQSAEGIRAGLTLVVMGTIAMVFLLARRWFDAWTGVVAAMVYGLMISGTALMSQAGHATQFVVLYAVGATLLLDVAMRRRSASLIFTAALLYGMAVLMKQAGVFFGIFGGAWLLIMTLRQKDAAWRSRGARLGLFALGAITPIAITYGWLLAAGTFDTMWFWTVQYAREYATINTAETAWALLKTALERISTHLLGPWILCISGLLLFWTHKSLRGRWVLLLGFTVASLCAVLPGMYFREHYFIQILPAATILAGTAVRALGLLLRRTNVPGPVVVVVLTLVFGAVIVPSLVAQWPLFFRMSMTEASRSVYGLNPFPESIDVAKYIQEHSEPEDRIAIFGSEPQIFFLSNRRSCTGYIYTYGLLEPHAYARTMQEEMIREVEAAAPKFCVYVEVSVSWLARAKSDLSIQQWAKDYLVAHYNLVGVVELDEPSVYVFGQQAATHRPRSPYFLYVFERMPNAPPPKSPAATGHEPAAGTQGDARS